MTTHRADAAIKNLITSARSAVILGFGTTGQAAAHFFLTRDKNIAVTVIEKQSRENFLLKPFLKKQVLAFEKEGIVFSFSDVIPDRVLKIKPQDAVCVISPGIARNSKTAERIKQIKLPIIGELELGLGLSEVDSIMVTGSNGKSTTVSLINAIFTYTAKKPFLCGNIGKPVLTLLSDAQSEPRPDVLVVEASSYQLESAQSVHPKVSAILNFCENHLERHGTMESYLKAKVMVARNQMSNEFIVLNGDDEKILAVKDAVMSQAALFGQEESRLTTKNKALIKYQPTKKIDEIIISLEDVPEPIIFRCEKTKLVGEHARYNIAAAALCVLLFIDRKTEVKECVAAIQRAIEEFSGLEHRLQPVPTQTHFLAINDSKSTTVASTVAAVRSITKAFPGHPLMLLLGGKVKLGSWQSLAECINELGDLVHVVCFGGDGLFIQQELQSFGIDAHLSKNVAMATTYACDWQREGEIILFSPGCASFDEFSNFEERGNFFSSVVGLR